MTTRITIIIIANLLTGTFWGALDGFLGRPRVHQRGRFARPGRKLKCDGNRPTCSNCERRRQPCAYDAVIKRRGPGKKTRARQHQQGQADPTPEPEQAQVAGPSTVPGAHMYQVS